MKNCIACGEAKELSEFHRHPQMKDGHLNKCAVCVRAYVRQWEKNNPDKRHDSYMRTVGAARRARGLKRNPNGSGRNVEARRRASLSYAHRRNRRIDSSISWDKELDDLVFAEAYDLCKRRTGKWQIDHIVPLNHKHASGLHNAFNLQVVPAAWNVKKGNRHMGTFFPI